jgi:hypothetical protein
VTNLGSSTVTIGALNVEGENQLEFAPVNDGCTNQALPPAGNCSVDVRFTPVFAGGKTAWLVIPTDDPVTPVVRVNLSGIAGATVIDQTPPEGSVTINNGASITKSRQVTLSLTAHDASGVAQVCVSNSNICSDWQTFSSTKEWTLPESDSAYTVYVWFRDSVGNAGAVPMTDDIVLDTTPPVVTPSIPGGVYNSSQTITLTANEPGTIFYTLDGTNPTANSTVYAGAIPLNTFSQLKFFAIDAAGNMGVIRSETYQIDSIPPTGSLVINNGAATTNSLNVLLTLSAQDASGLAQMSFSNNGSNWTQPESYGFTKSWILPAGDGLKTVYVKYQDKVGNWSQIYPASITLKTTNKLHLNFAGSGGGSVTSDPTGIACTESCVGNFTLDTLQVKLMALADTDSSFDGWSYCDGTEACFVPINNDPTVTVTFNSLDPVRLFGNPFRFYDRLIDACTAAKNDTTATIHTRAVELSDPGFDFNYNIYLKLKGGYDGSFSSPTGYTTINGALCVTKGILEVDSIIVK